MGNPFWCHMMRPAQGHQARFYWSGYLWKGESVCGSQRGEGEVWEKMGLSSEKVGFALHNEFLELLCSIAQCLNGTGCYVWC